MSHQDAKGHPDLELFDGFLSYRSTHRVLATALRAAVQAQPASFRLWFDEARDPEDEKQMGIGPGDAIMQRIVTGLARSRSLIALISPNYFDSEACCRELELSYLASWGKDADRGRVLILCPSDGVDHLPFAGLRNLRAEIVGLEAWTAGDPTRRLGEIVERASMAVVRYLGKLRAVSASPLAIRSAGAEGRATAVLGRHPMRPHRYVVGRLRETWRIQDALEEASVDVGATRPALRCALVTGIPGIGKATLVRHFCDRWGLGYPGGSFWLNLPPTGDRLEAGQRLVVWREAARLELRAVAVALGLPLYDAASDSLELLRSAIAGCLADGGRPFLWIVNGIPPEMGASDLEVWLAPQTPLAHQLLTAAAGSDALMERHVSGEPIGLGELPLETARALLDRRVARDRPLDSAQERADAIEVICSRVGGYPLGLEAALTYLEMDRYSAASSLADLLGRAGTLVELERIALHVGGLASEHRLGVARAFELLLNRLRPDSARVLAVLAIADGLEVPVVLLGALLAGLAPATAPLRPGELRQLAAASGTVESLAGELQALGLIEPRTEGQTLRTGRGVALVVQSVLSGRRRFDEAVGRLKQLVLSALDAHLPLAWHEADSIAGLGHRVLGLSPDDEFVVALAGFLHRGARFREASHLWRFVVEVHARRYGPEHAVTQLTSHRYTDALRAAGELREAERLARDGLELSRRTLGPDHDDTWRWLRQLGSIRFDQGDLAEARSLLSDALEARERAVGSDHPDTLSVLHELTQLLFNQGEWTAARGYAERGLNATRQLYGDEDDRTLSWRNIFAEVLRETDHVSGARNLLESLLETRRRLSGPDHPDTLLVMSHLGTTLMQQGDLSAARDVSKQALELWRRRMGSEHPQVPALMSNVAVILARLGESEPAKLLQTEALDMAKRLLGEGHPSTFELMNNAATTLSEAGELDAARTMGQAAVDGLTRLFGHEHMQTQAAMANLAMTLRQQGDTDALRELETHLNDHFRKLVVDAGRPLRG